jgi:hypothetical protein
VVGKKAVELYKRIKYQEYCDTLNLIYEEEDYLRYGEVHDSLLQIVVDTDTEICKADYYTCDDSNFLFKATPIFIKNVSKDTITVGYNNFLSFELEAIDDNGDWKIIERRIPAGCGNEMTYISILPGDIVISSVIKYSGGFETMLRLKLDGVYSKPFKGSINKSQFEEQY